MRQIKELEDEILNVKKTSGREVERISAEKQAEIEKVKLELEVESLNVKETCRREIEHISKEKQAEIEKVKLEAERTTGGLRKLYQSLQVCLLLCTFWLHIIMSHSL